MKNTWRAVSGEEARVRQTKKMQQNLLSMYRDIYKEVQYALRTGTSKQDLSKVQLMMLESDIKSYMEEINKNLENDVRESMDSVCLSVVEDKRELLKQYGFSADYIRDSYIYVPKAVVNNILSGTIYQEDWSLSKAIWGNTQNFNQKLTRIVAEGTATGKSAYEIAKDLEQYVNPDARKTSRKIKFQKYKTDALGNVMRDENGKPMLEEKVHWYKPGDVDYNAQRLTRTMISHAYQQAFMHVNADDPFVTKYVWISALQHGRTCALCRDRHGQLFDKDKLPLDHPNGMCTFEAYIPGGVDGVRDMMLKWMDEPIGKYPEIDRYADHLLRKYEGKGLVGYR